MPAEVPILTPLYTESPAQRHAVTPTRHKRHTCCRRTWLELKPEGLRPKARYAHSLTSCNGRVYLFGGESNTCESRYPIIIPIGIIKDCLSSRGHAAVALLRPTSHACSAACGCLDAERPCLQGRFICGMGAAGAAGAGACRAEGCCDSRWLWPSFQSLDLITSDNGLLDTEDAHKEGLFPWQRGCWMPRSFTHCLAA